MNWLLDYVFYRKTQKAIVNFDPELLELVGEKMKRAARYMQDHEGNIPPIGDTLLPDGPEFIWKRAAGRRHTFTVSI